MDPFLLPITVPRPATLIRYPQRLLLVGSCFTEHIGRELEAMKFDVLMSPNGILFDPLSVTRSLTGYLQPEIYRQEQLFFGNELWQSWEHHGRFSQTSRALTLENINASQHRAHEYLLSADWLIVTLGSAFTYFLKEGNRPVANCHRMPAGDFDRRLLSIEHILAAFDETLHRLREVRPDLQVVFTVSPVRHVRDGVIDNNRSKARLLEAVHQLTDKFDGVWYFPAYELVIDVLRDYRFYDIDLAHPNYQATSFVLEHFMENYMDDATRNLSAELKKLVMARRHRPLHPDTAAHRRFLQTHASLARRLQDSHPFLDLREEIAWFANESGLPAGPDRS